MPTNFLEAAGTNGYIVTPFDLLSTETLCSSMINGSAIQSSVGGPWSQTDIGNAIWGEVVLSGGGAFTPNAGGYFAGWFQRSKDGGTVYEAMKATASGSVSALSRPPDFTIQMPNAAVASGDLFWSSGLIKLPFGKFKAVLQNFTGVTANINHVTLAPVAIQY